MSEAKEKGHLSTFQRQAIIRLIEKIRWRQEFIQNWRPISLLNVELKLISKDYSEKLKTLLPDLISTQQTAYVKNIGESGRLISVIIEIARLKKLKGFLVTMDIKRAFDSLDHNFLMSTLEKNGFSKNFIWWVKIY